MLHRIFVRGAETSEGEHFPPFGDGDQLFKVVLRIALVKMTFGTSPPSVMKSRCVV